jgi:hypothetical protein
LSENFASMSFYFPMCLFIEKIVFTSKNSIHKAQISHIPRYEYSTDQRNPQL